MSQNIVMLVMVGPLFRFQELTISIRVAKFKTDCVIISLFSYCLVYYTVFVILYNK